MLHASAEPGLLQMHHKCWGGFSTKALQGWFTFVKLALPSMVSASAVHACIRAAAAYVLGMLAQWAQRPGSFMHQTPAVCGLAYSEVGADVMLHPARR